MSRTVTAILVVIAFGLGAAAGIFGFLWATGGNAEESQDIQSVAPTLSLDDPTPASNEVATQVAELSGKVDELALQVAAIGTGVAEQPQVIITEEATPGDPTEVPTEEATEEATEEVAQSDTVSRALFRIVPDESEARFIINEILMGNPTRVVGATNRVAGDIIVNFEDPSASQVGQIAINARTLQTDNEFRDQSIRSRILQSSRDEYEFINFTPTQLTGLTGDSVSVGDTLEFQIVGDLTIKDTTRSVTFDATATVSSSDRIEGTASVQVLYADYGISIQAPPTVSGIEDEVILEIDFVATLVDEA